MTIEDKKKKRNAYAKAYRERNREKYNSYHRNYQKDPIRHERLKAKKAENKRNGIFRIAGVRFRAVPSEKSGYKAAWWDAVSKAWVITDITCNAKHRLRHATVQAIASGWFNLKK